MSFSRYPFWPAVATLIAVAALAGCDVGEVALAHGDRVGDDSSATEDEILVGRTVWTDSHEIFFDHSPLVVDTPADFHIHITENSTGSRKSLGALTLELSGPEGARRRETVQPSAEGVYEPRIALERSGNWNLRFEFELRAASAAVVEDLAVFGSVEEASDAVPPDPPGTLTVLKEQLWVLKVISEPATERRLSGWEVFPARIESRPAGVARVLPPLAGRLLPPEEGGFPSLGQRVEAGQILARIEPPLSGPDLISALASYHELETHEAEMIIKVARARAEEEDSRSALKFAESKLERVKGLAEVQAKSPRELEEARLEAEAARVRHELARTAREPYENALKLLTEHPLHDQPIVDRFPPASVHAPISGVIDRVEGCLGAYVETQTALFVVVDNSTVLVECRVPESAIAAVQASTRALLRVPGRDDRLEMPLKPVHTGLRLDEFRRLPLTFSADNEDGILRPGMLVEVAMETQPASERLAVPVGALVDDRGERIVMVQTGGESFERRPVIVGARQGGFVEILSGLKPGERVVTRGAYGIRMASLSAAIPGHH